MRTALLLSAICGGVAAVVAVYLASVATNGPLLDFLVFWTAAHAPVSQLYDMHALTATQAAFLHRASLPPRPFAYPPTALLWFAPLRMLGFGAGALAWSAAGLTAFVAASRLLLRPRELLMLACAPMVFLTLAAGQVTLLVGAATLAAVAWLPRRPKLAGVLFGLAATLKPQALLALPIGLLAAGAPVALVVSGLTASAIGLLSLLIYGAGAWAAWPRSLGDLAAAAQQVHLQQITPLAFGTALGLAPAVSYGLGACAGLLTAWLAFRCDHPAIRMFGLVVGSVLCSPYALSYELAPLAPASILLISRPEPVWRGALGLLGLLGVNPLATGPLLIGGEALQGRARILWRGPA